jgi:periplasmic protein TonB
MTGKSATPTLNVKRSSLSPPDVIHRVPPKFPEFARRSNPAGDRVVLNVTVGKDGRVGNIQVVRGQPMFSDAAVNAVKQWQYRPAFLNGDPVEATVEVVISFTNGR